MLHWTTDRAAPRDRFEAWRGALCDTHLPWQLHRPARGPFRAELRAMEAGALGIVTCRCDPCAGYRDRRTVRGGEDDRYGVLVVTRGRERVRQGEISCELGPGSAMIWDAGQPAEFEVLEPLSKCTLFLSKDRVHAMTGSSRLPLGPLDSARGFGALLAGRVAALEALMEDFDGASGERLGLSLAQDVIEAAGLSARVEPPRQTLLRRIARIIETGLSDPDLGPAEVAVRAGVSTRYLHLLFRDEGETCGARILRLRLEAVAADLRDPRLGEASVTQIGFSRGFSSAAHLSRAFRARFGTSPSDWRREG